ncbi:MAG TPA: GFA family protein [Gallionella sp.]|nr:GFA family protein [Gallionella sp.]
MKTYQGGCHCGQVRFEIETDLVKATECNCSICTKKGVLHHRVPPERFKLLAGQEALSLYQAGKKIAKHWFCRHCGIHAFSNPRAAPEQFSINIRCLDDFHRVKSGIEIVQFDGQNWEEAVKGFKF